MTVTVRGIKKGGGVEGSQSIEQDEYTVIYYVVTDERRDGPRTIMTAFGIPNIGDTYVAGHDFDNAAVVIDKSARQRDDCPFEWDVTVTYSTAPESDPSAFAQDNPLLQPAEISYGFQARRVLIPGSYNDPLGPPNDNAWQQGIFAPNGELFDPQPEWELYEPVLTIKRNLASISGAAFMSLANCVNSDVYQNAQPRQLRMLAPTAVRKWHRNVPPMGGFYWEATFAMAFRWETWDIQVLNQGTYYFTGGKPASVWSTTVARKTKTDDHGNPLIVNLSTNGDINTTTTPTFFRRRVAREISFSNLDLLGNNYLNF